MEPDTRPPDTSARLRLVEIKVSADRAPIQLGGRFAGVLAAPEDRNAAARWIATTVTGPRPAGSDGSVDLGGQVLPVHSLPPRLLPPGAPVLVDLDVVRAHWQAACTEHRDELAAEHASSRLEGYRLEAAVERARARATAPPELERVSIPAPALEPVPEPEPARNPELRRREPRRPEPRRPEPRRPEPRRVVRPDALGPSREYVRSLLTALESPDADPLPEALLLADAWDAHASLVRVRKAVDALPAADVDALEQRVNAARTAVTVNAGGVPDDVRAHLEACHRAVVDTEAAAFNARRRERGRAIAHYEEAVAAELLALADAGIDSYASFLAAVAAAEAHDPARQLAAQAELAAARTALDAALQVPDVPTRAELEERGMQIRVRATELLGRRPGEDPAAELRAFRIAVDVDGEKVAEIGGVLRGAGVEVTVDVLASARAFVVPPPPDEVEEEPEDVEEELEPDAPPVATAVPAPEPAPLLDPVPSAAETKALIADLEALEQQRFGQARALQAVEAELARVDAVYATDVPQLTAPDLARALETMLAAYRGGRFLGGQVPLVIDGVFDGLAPAAREAAVKLLAQADDVQSIVVSDDPEVMQSVANAGGMLVRWPQAATA